MDDPLSRALGEALEKGFQQVPDMLDSHTPRRRELCDILDDIKSQASSAMRTPFFDGGVDENREPIIQRGATEAGTVHVSARHAHPPYCANLTIYVRSDKEPTPAGHFHVRARCKLSSESQQPPLHREFTIGMKIADDGTYTLDVEQMRSEMADTIRSFGKPSNPANR
jgi:hypothetical protein